MQPKTPPADSGDGATFSSPSIIITAAEEPANSGSSDTSTERTTLLAEVEAQRQSDLAVMHLLFGARHMVEQCVQTLYIATRRLLTMFRSVAHGLSRESQPYRDAKALLSRWAVDHVGRFRNLLKDVIESTSTLKLLQAETTPEKWVAARQSSIKRLWSLKTLTDPNRSMIASTARSQRQSLQPQFLQPSDIQLAPILMPA